MEQMNRQQAVETLNNLINMLDQKGTVTVTPAGFRELAIAYKTIVDLSEPKNEKPKTKS